jgi:hypothetical protein
MSRRKTFLASVMTAGLAVALFAPSDAQTSGRVRGSDSQKPVVSTYNKAPDPRGRNQDIDTASYEEPADRTVNPPTYNKTPDPSGANQDIDAARYKTDSSGNEPSQAGDASDRGDDQKPVVRTYDNPPEAQSNTVTTRPNDVSSVDEPHLGDTEKPVIPTYDKRPDPKGEAQKLDAVRYDQENHANDGQPGELQMRVIEGAVEE